MQCTEMSYASFLSGGFTTMAVINPLQRNLAKCTSVQWSVQGIVVLWVDVMPGFLPMSGKAMSGGK